MDARCGNNNKALNFLKKKKKITRESHPSFTKQCSSFKETHKLKILKLGGFITLQN